jgi:hypothetical protein
MKTTILWVILAVLAAATLGCNVGNATSTPSGDTISDFPLPGETSNYTRLSEGMLTFETNMSIDEVVAFYRDTFSKEGYTERTQLTYTNEAAFGLIFDGHPSGQEFVIEGTDLGATTTITIRLRNID